MAHLDSDQLRKESEERLAGLKDALQKKKKVGKLSSEPGALLATRAAAVAESSKCKKKTGDKAISILKKAISGKGVEEVDYEDNEQEKDSEEYSGSEEEEEKLLGDGLGSSSACRRCREGCHTTSTESEPGWVSKEEMRSGCLRCPEVTQVITCGRKPTGGGLWENL